MSNRPKSASSSRSHSQIIGRVDRQNIGGKEITRGSRPTSSHAVVRSTAIANNVDDDEDDDNNDGCEYDPEISVKPKGTGIFASVSDKIRDKKRLSHSSLLEEKLHASHSNTPLGPLGEITVIGFESSAFIGGDKSVTHSHDKHHAHKQNNHHDHLSHPTVYSDISPEESGHIRLFNKMINRKSILFEDPSQLAQQRKQRKYKDNDLVIKLARLEPGFNKPGLLHEDNADSEFTGSKKSVFSSAGMLSTTHQRPKYFDSEKDFVRKSNVTKLPRYCIIIDIPYLYNTDNNMFIC